MYGLASFISIAYRYGGSRFSLSPDNEYCCCGVHFPWHRFPASISCGFASLYSGPRERLCADRVADKPGPVIGPCAVFLDAGGTACVPGPCNDGDRIGYFGVRSILFPGEKTGRVNGAMSDGQRRCLGGVCVGVSVRPGSLSPLRRRCFSERLSPCPCRPGAVVPCWAFPCSA